MLRSSTQPLPRDPAFLRCLGCGADRRTGIEVCPGCGSIASALVVVGWSMSQAKRADRIAEWKRSIKALSWATKAGLLAAMVAGAIAAGTLKSGLVCVVIPLGVIALSLLSTAWHHARRPPFEDHARGDASWMFAGRWLYAVPDGSLGEEDLDADEGLGDALVGLAERNRSPLSSVAAVERRPGSTPELQRLVLRIARDGKADRCRLEFAVDESTATHLAETIRSRLAPGESDWRSELWRSAIVDPSRDPRLSHVGRDALVMPCTPDLWLSQSIRRTDAAAGAFARSMVLGLISFVPIAAIGGCSGAGPTMIAAVLAVALAVWIAVGARFALKARERWSRGGARFLVVERDALGFAQDLPERPLVRPPLRAIALTIQSRPDRRQPGRIGLLSTAATPIAEAVAPATFEAMDAPTLWSLADEITRRMAR